MKAVNENEKIICFGHEFSSEDERRTYFRSELRNKLPHLKTIEGFPIGDDENILNLSDPPYYTACPNPWLNDFIQEWEMQKNSVVGRTDNFHVDEPFTSDVAEGKNNSIYNAHSYHTKVPHPAIMRYILHYTQPGDIVIDSFAGTGMTNVAAQICSNPDDETKYKIEKEFKELGLSAPSWGVRNSLGSDLSPIATFISYNYNTPQDSFDFRNEATALLKEVQKELGWMYETKDGEGQKAEIKYTVYSEVFLCSVCNQEIIFWDAAVDVAKGDIREEFNCPSCGGLQTKRTASKAKVTVFDPLLNTSISEAKMVPVLINYTGNSGRGEKKPDDADFANLKKIEEFKNPYPSPLSKLENGDKTSDPFNKGIFYAHQFYFKRELCWLSALFAKANNNPKMRWLAISITNTVSKMYRFVPQKPNYNGQGGGMLSGTLYVPSLIRSLSVVSCIDRSIGRLGRAYFRSNTKPVISVGSATKTQLPDNSIDYVFTDPPFGANIMYSELNFIWESWLSVKTNNRAEAIESKSQGKSLLEYNDLMTKSFSEYYRVLKPGKWMTVEFSNTNAAVWNGIQTSIQKAGFVIANVSGLDKKQGSFNAVTNPTSVKQDLILSCYKPREAFFKEFNVGHGEGNVWTFINEHLTHLPIQLTKNNVSTSVVERSPKILYDRLITFSIMRNHPVPLDAKDFQEALKKRYVERDGMFFTAEQVSEYDEKRAKSSKFVQLSLVVSTESDAIEWLKERLRGQRQKYQDIMPDFRIATQSLRKGDTLPELQQILNENFILESDSKWRTPNPSESRDREMLRTKFLLKEFNTYVEVIAQPKAKKLKEVRVEALRVGFKDCWERKDFKTISVLGDKIPQNILLEDEQLLMYYDIAKDRI